MKEKGFAPILLVILIATVAVGYLLYAGKINLNKPQPVNNQTTQSSPSDTIANNTSSWKTYTDSITKFSIKYPSDWKISEGPKEFKDETSGYQYLSISGDQGNIVVGKANQLGGACPPTYETVQLKNFQATTCHYTSDDNKEHWDQIYIIYKFGNDLKSRYALIVSATAMPGNSEIVKNIISSIDEGLGEVSNPPTPTP